MGLTPETAAQLARRGLISEETYARATNMPSAVSGNTLAVPADLPAPPPAPAPAPTQEAPKAGWEQYDPIADEIAQKNGIDPQLFKAMLRTENEPGDPRARSKAGAVGLGQIMPDTAADIAKRLNRTEYNLEDPRTSIEFAGNYFGDQLKQFKDPRLALAAYNAGPGTVGDLVAGGKGFDEVAGLLPEETRNYVPKIMGRYAPSSPSSAPADAQLPVRPKTKLEEGLEAQLEGAALATRAGELEAKRQTGFAREMQDQLKVTQAQAEQEKADLARRLEEARVQREQAFAELKDTSIDTGRLWSNMSTGGKVVAALGAVLVGTLISPGVAMSLINGAIGRDIAEQRMGRNAKREQLEQSNGLYNSLLERYGDASRAAAEAKTTYLQMTIDKLDTLASPYKGDEIQARYQNTRGALLKEYAKAEQEANEAAMKSPVYQDSLTKMYLEGYLKDPNLLPKDVRERVVPGIGIAATDLDAQELKKKGPAVAALNSVIAKMKELRENNSMVSSQLGDTSVKRQYESLRGKADVLLKQVGGLGSYDTGVERLADKMFPTTESMIGFRNAIERVQGIDPVQVQLDETLQNLNNEWENEKQLRLGRPSPQTLGREGVR